MSAIRCSCVRPSVLSPMFKCDKHKEKPEEPKQEAPYLDYTGERWIPCYGCAIHPTQPKQKACECYQTVNGKVHCALHCPNGYDHSKLNPAPSLNNWEMEFDEKFTVGNPDMFWKPGGFAKPKEVKQFIASQIILAIQKEREEKQHLENQIEKLANFILFEVPGEPSQDQGAIDTAIRLIKANLISNKGVERQ